MTLEEVDCVYALGNEALPGLIKIGMTSNLKRRVSELSSASLPEEFYVVAYIPTKDLPVSSIRLENKVHKLLCNYRVSMHREFFEISESKVKSIFKSISENEGCISEDISVRKTPLRGNVTGSKSKYTYNKHFKERSEFLNTQVNMLTKRWDELDSKNHELSIQIREQENTLEVRRRLLEIVEKDYRVLYNQTEKGLGLIDIYKEDNVDLINKYNILAAKYNELQKNYDDDIHQKLTKENRHKIFNKFWGKPQQVDGDDFGF